MRRRESASNPAASRFGEVAPLRSVALMAALLVGACSPSPPEHAQPEGGSAATPALENKFAAGPVRPVTDQAGLSILLRSDGLLVETSGHGAPLTFGTTTPQQAMQALGELGAPRRSSNAECPAGPLDFMDWDNGLQLAFQDGKLAGWWARESSRDLATTSGLGPGSPRSAIGSAKVDDSSVGKIFTVGDISGLLDEESGTRVTALWAGLACIFS